MTSSTATSTLHRRCSRPSRLARANGCSRSPPTTPAPANSSVGRSAAFRPSSTSAPTCWSISSGHGRTRRRPWMPWTVRMPRPPAKRAGARAWRRRCARRRCATPRKRTSRFTAASASTGGDSAHLYFRRARTDEVVFGSPAQHWDRLSALDPSTQLSASPEVTKDLNEVDALRAEIRSFLHNAPRPAGLRNYGPTPTADDVEPGRVWHRYLADHGYACLHWPREFGGAAATVTYQAVFAEECARADVPRQLNITGADLVGPVLIKFGSQDHKDRYLEA